MVYSRTWGRKITPPVSGRRATISFLCFLAALCQLGRRPHGSAGRNAHQHALMAGQRAAWAKASSFSTGIISSYTVVFKVSGIKPAPMPWIL